MVQSRWLSLSLKTKALKRSRSLVREMIWRDAITITRAGLDAFLSISKEQTQKSNGVKLKLKSYMYTQSSLFLPLLSSTSRAMHLPTLGLPASICVS